MALGGAPVAEQGTARVTGRAAGQREREKEKLGRSKREEKNERETLWRKRVMEA
jgi:hypothetical protein